MGAWGSGIFDNDDAADVRGDVDEADDPAEVVGDYLDEWDELDDDDVDLGDLNAAVAAAVLVAIARGAAFDGTGGPERWTTGMWSPKPKLVKRARKILVQVTSPESVERWKDLWDDEESQQQYVETLRPFLIALQG